MTWRVINNWQNQSRISSELDAQQALVSETEGTIKADEASVASAVATRLEPYHAPVDGRVGLKQVDVGNQISSGDTT